MNPRRKIRACVLYARISLAKEESVSIERQLEAGRAYAKARGWDVVATFVDEGVSATHNRPDERKAWSALLAHPTPYDAVVVWKVDRLARKVLDFLNANESVKARGAGIVAVEDPIDMTTAQGEAFAIMLAVFGQMEAAAIRDRQLAARNHLLRSGRYPGGLLPYGYRSTPNPTGPGHVVEHDPERIDTLREMVRRTLAGRTIYSTLQWLEESDAPAPRGNSTKWHYSTVDRLMRNPLLAGMVSHNPGITGLPDRKGNHDRGDDVLRDQDGLPVIDETLAVLPVSQWRAMQALLDDPTNTRKKPRNGPKYSAALSGLLWCADPRHDEPVRMYRGTVGTGKYARPGYYCQQCRQTISAIEDLIVGAVMERVGDTLRLRMVEEVVEGGSVQLREASVRLAELSDEVVNATPERAEVIWAEQRRLKAIQEDAKRQPNEVRYVPAGGPDRTYADDYADATDDTERRAILGQAVDRILVHRNAPGHGKRPEARLARLEFEWLEPDTPTDADLASWGKADRTVI